MPIGHQAKPSNHGHAPDESQKVAKGDHDVGIVGPGLLDHAAKLGVAVGADHREDARGDPHRQRHVDTSGVLQQGGGGAH